MRTPELNSAFENTEYHTPSVNAYLKSMPPLYAFRMAAKSNGAIAMAQGSPQYGPPANALDRFAQDMKDYAEMARYGAPHKMAGYLDYADYIAAKEIAVPFLQKIMGLDGDFDTLMDRMNLGGFARVTMQDSLRAITSKGLDRANDRFIVTQGVWPLVLEIADDMGIPYSKTKNHRLNFADYREIMDDDPASGTHVLYFCDPNNPLDYKYTHEEIYNFMKNVDAYIKETDKNIKILADNPYWGWCSRQYIEENGFPSFTKIADAIKRNEGLSVHPHLVEIFSLGKALGLASSGGSIALFADETLLIDAHKNQSSFHSLPAYAQLSLMTHTLQETIDNPEFILERSDSIHNNLHIAHRTLNETFDKNPHLEVYSYDGHGPYITLELSEEMFGQTVTVQGKKFEIKNATDACIYLLDEHKVAITPLDDRDLPNCVRIFVDLPKQDFNKGMNGIVNGLKILSESSPAVTLSNDNAQTPKKMLHRDN